MTVSVEAHGPSILSIAYNENSVSNRLWSSPVLFTRDTASAAGSIMLGRCSTTKLNSESFKSHRASRAVKSVKLIFHTKAS